MHNAPGDGICNTWRPEFGGFSQTFRMWKVAVWGEYGEEESYAQSYAVSPSHPISSQGALSPRPRQSDLCLLDLGDTVAWSFLPTRDSELAAEIHERSCPFSLGVGAGTAPWEGEKAGLEPSEAWSPAQADCLEGLPHGQPPSLLPVSQAGQCPGMAAFSAHLQQRGLGPSWAKLPRTCRAGKKLTFVVANHWDVGT